MLVHLTAHALGALTPLADFDLAAFVWERLRDAYPATVAACLMPQHVHLASEVGDADGARRRLAAVLGGAARLGGRHAPMWQPLPEAEPLRGRQHIERMIRYIVLNPSRAPLTRDPLEWLWSTHRDVMGAVVDPWVTADRLARVLGRSRADFAARHHAYVSADPTVSVIGSPPPRAVAPSPSATLPLARLAAAAAAATRSALAAVRSRSVARHLFVQLAVRDGWRNVGAIAEVCGITPRAVRLLRAAPVDPAALTAAARCAGDDRLLGYLAAAARAGAVPCRP
ncbi:MAG TPA: hypothetical protein VGQ83_11270 [Polyangia bacterium]